MSLFSEYLGEAYDCRKFEGGIADLQAFLGPWKIKSFRRASRSIEKVVKVVKWSLTYSHKTLDRLLAVDNSMEV